MDRQCVVVCPCHLLPSHVKGTPILLIERFNLFYTYHNVIYHFIQISSFLLQNAASGSTSAASTFSPSCVGMCTRLISFTPLGSRIVVSLLQGVDRPAYS